MVDSPLDLPDPPLGGAAERGLRALERVAGAAALKTLTGPELMLERARLLGLTFRDRIAPGGACRLLDAADGTIAVNLPRDSDWELLSAWLETNDAIDTAWDHLARAVRERPVDALEERARILGLAVAAVRAPASTPPPFFRVEGPPLNESAVGSKPVGRAPRVIDLSALWAGPLCGHLLHLCGAEVVKVEALDRPDGARFGNADFYALLNQGKRSVAVDFGSAHGRQALARLIETADIVIEASRPRALAHLGIRPEEVVRRCPKLTWVSITGYGRSEPAADWIAFGDDAGVAAGLGDVMRSATGAPQFAGDAIADPLTGIQAALAAWCSWTQGGGRLIGLALADVAGASQADALRHLGREALLKTWGQWWCTVTGRRLDASTGTRTATAPVRELGADTAEVLAALEPLC